MEFSEALTLLFVTLKLLGKIDWSWWWVTSPEWIVYAILLPICLIIYVLISQKS